MHKRLEEWDHQHPGEQIDNASRWKVITNASVEVGPALFISLLIITLSFIQSLPWRGRKGGCLARWRSRKRIPWRGGRAGNHRHSDPDGILDPGENSCGDQQPLNRLLIKAYHPLLLRYSTGQNNPAGCGLIHLHGYLATESGWRRVSAEDQ
jgi:Cu(I)/Ag(I) efflux system membrane protein CusA/SilA